jgi:acetyltransferase-like isoleucine patch superfamily enzyme
VTVVEGRIEADRVTVEDDVILQPGSVIRGSEVVLRRGARVGRNAEITCDSLDLGVESRIGDGSRIVSPEIVLHEGCSIGSGFEAELNEYFRLGRRSSIGKRVAMVGQGVQSGEFLWLKDDVVIGGGGARGPRSYFTVGDQSSVFDRCYINLSEKVTLGSGTALSSNVVLLTHGAWQPALMGFRTNFAPISIGDYSVVYLNSVVMPGVTIGNYSTIGAGSLVLNDVPDRCLVAGSPARIIKGPERYPTPLDQAGIDALIEEALADYLTTLPGKGVRIISAAPDSRSFTVEVGGRRETVRYVALSGDSTRPGVEGGQSPTITVAHGSGAAQQVQKQTQSGSFFDLQSETVTGELTPLAEDLRDYFRRRAIRFFTDRPFKTLPLANLQRLQARWGRKAP